MPVVPFLWRLQFGGPLFNLETWSCGLHFQGTIDVVPAVNLLPPLTAWMDSMSNTPGPWNREARLGFIKFNAIDPVTGKQAPGAPTNAHFLSPARRSVGTGGGVHPPQLATCVSLRTVLARGRAHAGRMYVPAIGSTDSQTGQMSAGEAGGINTSTADMIKALNLLLPGKKCVIFSKIGQQTQEVTGCRTGRVIDTQRRRRTNLLEEYGPVDII